MTSMQPLQLRASLMCRLSADKQLKLSLLKNARQLIEVNSGAMGSLGPGVGQADS